MVNDQEVLTCMVARPWSSASGHASIVRTLGQQRRNQTLFATGVYLGNVRSDANIDALAMGLTHSDSMTANTSDAEASRSDRPDIP